jgi:hypothetical protein
MLFDHQNYIFRSCGQLSSQTCPWTAPTPQWSFGAERSCSGVKWSHAKHTLILGLPLAQSSLKWVPFF